MRLLQRTIAITVAAKLAATVAWCQWNFTVDPSFQTQISQRNVGSLLLNDDGSISASGIMRFPGEFSDKRLVRLLPNGTRDESFYNSGLGGVKLTRWEDRFYVGTSGTVRRILPSGIQDPSFIEMNYGLYFNSLQGGDYHVYPDGRVLMSGNHNLSDTARGFVGRYQLIWFTSTGYLDTTRTHRSGGSCAVYRFKELPNGQFICNGLCDQFDGQEIDRVFRVNADGSVDTTFHTGVYTGEARDYLGLPDGRVYTCGNFRRTDAPNDTLRLVRFMPDGSLDPSFTIPQFTAGEGLSTSFAGAYVYTINPWRDGTLIITGHFKRVNGQVRKGICMIDTTGQLLDAFNGAGVGPFTYQGLTAASVQQIIFNADSTQAYICGGFNGYDDGTTNATGQLFVTRLNVQEIITAVPSLREEEATGLLLLPNPASTYVAMNYSLPGNTGTGQLRLRDASGRVVHTLQVAEEQGQQVWDTRGTAPGVYSVELLRDGRVERSERLVIQP